MRLPGACHVHFVRSAVAHARIRSVDVSAALEAPGVIAVFTGADLADLPPMAPPMAGMINAQMGQPLLARDVVRYVGEPVAVVVTEEPLPGRGRRGPGGRGLRRAAAGDRHDHRGRRRTRPCCSRRRAPTSPPPWATPRPWRADLFDGCEVVVSRTIVNQRVAPAPMETRAAAAVLGRGRPADRVDPEPGRAGHPRGAGRHARHRPGHRCGSSPRTWAARSAPSSAPTRSTRWSAGSPGSWAGPRAGPRPATRTWSA